MSTETRLPPPQAQATALPPPTVLAPPTTHQMVEPPLRPIAQPSPAPFASDSGPQSPPAFPQAMAVRPVEDLRVESRRLPKIPFELFLILVVAVVLLGVFVVSTGSKRGDAESGRADAEARVAVAESSAREMAAVNVELIEKNSEVELQIEALEQDLQDALKAREAIELELASIPEIEPVDTSGLEAEIAALTDENINLLEQLETLELQLADAPTISAAFTQYIGEQLSNSSLDVAQAQCFGSYVIERVGLEGLGVGLNSDRTSEANDAVTTAMSEGAAECDIDPGLVFGQ